MDDWVTQPRLARLTASREAVSWLTERGSLTARLRRRYPGLAVKVRGEGLERLLPWEARKLDLAPERPAWVREVTLHQDGLELVQARTAIPDWSPDNPWCEVQRLGERPLGEILFSDTGLERSEFEFALGNGWLPPGASPADARLARRCVFRRRGAALLLTERFLQLAP